MAGFREAAAYGPIEGLQLLPLRFEQLRHDRYLVNNFVGDGLLLTRQELDRIVSLDLIPGDGLGPALDAASGTGKPLRLLLTAHGLPKRIVSTSGPTKSCSFQPRVGSR